jgi:hypothetical protein
MIKKKEKKSTLNVYTRKDEQPTEFGEFFSKGRKKKEKKDKKEKKEKKEKKPTQFGKFKKNKYHKTKETIETQGYLIPNNPIVTDSQPPQIHHQMTGGGIPYTSVFDNFGITNKPPYFLESFIAKTAPMTYSIPTPSSMSTTISGSNPMTQSKTKMFEEQTKPKSIEYVDLVEPSLNGNKETQPDYVLFDSTFGNPLLEKVEKNLVSPLKKVAVEQNPTQFGATFSKGGRRSKKEMIEAKEMGNEDKKMGNEDKQMKRLVKQEKINKIKEEKKIQNLEIKQMKEEDKQMKKMSAKEQSVPTKKTLRGQKITIEL